MDREFKTIHTFQRGFHIFRFLINLDLIGYFWQALGFQRKMLLRLSHIDLRLLKCLKLNLHHFLKNLKIYHDLSAPEFKFYSLYLNTSLLNYFNYYIIKNWKNFDEN